MQCNFWNYSILAPIDECQSGRHLILSEKLTTRGQTINPCRKFMNPKALKQMCGEEIIRSGILSAEKTFVAINRLQRAFPRIISSIFA
jgi:hypothetical protein